MIQTIEKNRKLNKYIYRTIEDAGVEVKVDDNLKENEYLGIKVDEYYMGQHLGGETPKAVDFIVTVNCGLDWYALYVLEMKDTGSYTTKEIEEIFLNDKYKYKSIKLYLITTAYKAALKYNNYLEWLNIQQRINGKDTLRYDRYLGTKLYRFRKSICRIEKEIPPNPLIQKIL